MKWLLTKQDSDLVIGVGQEAEKTWKYKEEQLSHQFADGGWDELALRMMGELITSKHPVFKC